MLVIEWEGQRGMLLGMVWVPCWGSKLAEMTVRLMDLLKGLQLDDMLEQRSVSDSEQRWAPKTVQYLEQTTVEMRGEMMVQMLEYG